MLPPLDSLVQPLDSGDGAGEDLTYDSAFLAFTRAAAGTPERGIGDELQAAEDPDWATVVALGTALFPRTHDLRVAVPLARSWLYLEGLPGLAHGLELIQQLVTDAWDAVHPRADEDGDLTMRFNSLSALRDEDLFLRRLRTLPLARSRAHGVATLRDSRLLTGRLKLAADSAEEVPDRGRIDGVYADAKIEDLQQVAGAARAAIQRVTALQQQIDEQAPGQGPEFKPLLDDLREIAGLLDDVIARRSGLDPAGAGGDGAAESGTADGQRAASAPGRAIASRADVVRMMDAICAYYREYEPSSPVPMLITRAKRLVNLSFLEALRDLSPSTVSDLERIAGVENSSD